MSLRVQRRGLVVGVVGAAHLLLLWLLAQTRPVEEIRESASQVINIMPINMPPEVRVVPPEPPNREAPRRALRMKAPRPIEPPAESSVITLPPEAPPGVDWQREAQIVARTRAEPAVESGKSLDSRPTVMPLPQNREYAPAPGDTNMRPDGSFGFWTTDGIYCESREPLMNHFEVWARSIPPRCYKRERQRPKPTQEFDLP